MNRISNRTQSGNITRSGRSHRVSAPVRAFSGAGALTAVLLLLLLVPTPAQGQISTASSIGNRAAPRVFYDCSGQISCQTNHMRTEIPWVSWVNDRTDADVHVIITSEAVGGNGRQYVLNFTGQGAMAHLTEELFYTSSGTDVERERLDGFTRALRLGLLRFAMESGLGSDFDLAYAPQGDVFSASELDGGGPMEVAAAYDPWNYWTFRAGLSGNMSIQESRSSHRLNPSLNVDRVTDAWKFNFSANANFNREKIELSDRVVRNDRDGWNLNTILVRSISSHLSTGLDVRGGRQQQNNRSARITANPAIEWNYYPYAQANRRQLIAHYGAGFQYNRYEEETVFGVMGETVPLHKLGIQYRAVEAWGNAGVSVDASQYLHGSGLYSYGVRGNMSFRVARGLELSVNGSAERIADQIHIRASQLSDEDILLGRQALPTSFSYQGSLGFNYRWGSSFSNIVNVRFPNSVR